MLLDKDTWEKYVKGYTILDCAASRKDMYLFVLGEDQPNNPHREPLPKTRFLFIYGDEPMGERCYCAQYDHFDFPRATSGIINGQREFVVVDLHGSAYFYNADADDKENSIDTSWLNGERRAGFSRVKRTSEKIYAVALDHFVFERKATKSWVEVNGLERPQERVADASNPLKFGFRDIDSFSPNDMYAVGGEGDVWHFDGQKWSQCPFPTNDWLYTVCCAGDGNVYITGNMGSLWVGRKDKWKRLLSGSFSIHFKDTIWFSGKLWCGSDYGLWTLENGKLVQPDIPATIKNAIGVTDTTPDGKFLISASPHGASLFDGQKWELLFSSFAFTGKKQAKTTTATENNTPPNLEQILDSIGNSGAQPTAELLSKSGIDKSIIKKNSYVLLLNAALASKTYPEYQNIIQQLLDMGADPEMVDAESGISVRTIAESLGVLLGKGNAAT